MIRTCRPSELLEVVLEGELSPLTGTAAIVVDGPGDEWPDFPFAEALLPSAPSVTVAVVRGRVGPGVGGFDLVLSGASVDERLAPVVAGVTANPLAALAMAQLLRMGEGLTLEAAVIAESFVYGLLQSGPEFQRWLATTTRPAIKAGTGPPVQVSRDGPSCRITLSRPHVHNAYNVAMRDALVEALAVAVLDSEIREVVLDGAGPSFCSGGDLSEFGSFPDPVTAHAVRSTRSAALAMARVGPRVLARVHGACVGAGIELAAFAQRVEVVGDAFFHLPEVAMGLVPGSGGTASLPRRIGRHRALWLALSGARLDAKTALRWGLVDRLVPAHST